MGLVGSLILILIATIIIFLICREIVCWYWKINTLVELMAEQNRLLSQIANKGSSINYETTPSSVNKTIENSNNNNSSTINKVYVDTWTCKNCGQDNSINSTTCKGCGEYK